MMRVLRTWAGIGGMSMRLRKFRRLYATTEAVILLGLICLLGDRALRRGDQRIWTYQNGKFQKTKAKETELLAAYKDGTHRAGQQAAEQLPFPT